MVRRWGGRAGVRLKSKVGESERRPGGRQKNEAEMVRGQRQKCCDPEADMVHYKLWQEEGRKPGRGGRRRVEETGDWEEEGMPGGGGLQNSASHAGGDEVEVEETVVIVAKGGEVRQGIEERSK